MVIKVNYKKMIGFLILIAALIWGFSFFSNKLMRSVYPQKYHETVFRYADEYNVDPNLVFAVMKTESNFDPDAVSRKDAKGLMQITDDSGEWLSEKLKIKNYSSDLLYDSETNIRIGTYFLKLLLEEFKEEDIALAAYNGGMGNVRKWLNSDSYSDDGETLHTIPFGETDHYVKKVIKTKAIYDKLYQKE